MSDRENMRRAEQGRRDLHSFTVNEWCEYRRISPAMFYKMDSLGLAPKSHFAGAKRLISGEADLEWVRAREAEAATANKTESAA
jgi:hypothetical protein